MFRDGGSNGGVISGSALASQMLFGSLLEIQLEMEPHGLKGLSEAYWKTFVIR